MRIASFQSVQMPGLANERAHKSWSFLLTLSLHPHCILGETLLCQNIRISCHISPDTRLSITYPHNLGIRLTSYLILSPVSGIFQRVREVWTELWRGGGRSGWDPRHRPGHQAGTPAGCDSGSVSKWHHCHCTQEKCFTFTWDWRKTILYLFVFVLYSIKELILRSSICSGSWLAAGKCNLQDGGGYWWEIENHPGKLSSLW